MRIARGLLTIATALALVAGCSDATPAPRTVVPPPPPTALTPDTGAPDGGSGDTTADELTDGCSSLSRVYFAATGAEGPATVLQPLYDAVTPLLPPAALADWELVAPVLIAYEDAASAVPDGEDQLEVPAVEAAYEQATSDDVQQALQRVRDAIDAGCPGFFD